MAQPTNDTDWSAGEPVVIPKRAPWAAFDLPVVRSGRMGLFGFVAGLVVGAAPAFCLGLNSHDLWPPLFAWIAVAAVGAVAGALLTNLRQVVRVEFVEELILLRDLGGVVHPVPARDIAAVVQRQPLARTGSPYGWTLSLHQRDEIRLPLLLSAGAHTQEIELALRDTAVRAVFVSTFGQWQVPHRPDVAAVQRVLVYEGRWHQWRAARTSILLAPFVLVPLIAGWSGVRALMEGRLAGSSGLLVGAVSFIVVAAFVGFIRSDWRWQRLMEAKLRRLLGEGNCHKCGYDLTGSPKDRPCSECGAARDSL